MFNLLLDPLPEDYEGYLIRTDYRIGVQISQALEDEELEPGERMQVALGLLFGNGVPEAETAFAGLQWFLSGGQEVENTGDEPEAGDGIRYFSFDADAGRLYSGFRRAYGVDLDKTQMHWFRFLALLADLGKCAFTQVVDYRSADLSKMDKETKKAYLAMRRKFALPQPESAAEQEFLRELHGNDVKN